MAKAQLIVDELKKLKITHVVGLPDNGSRALYELLAHDAEIEVVSVCREGEAFAIASGLYVGGKRPAALIQNTGFLESGDGFRGTAYNMAIPLVTLIGYRGYETMGKEREDSAATFLEPTLKAWNIPYYMLHGDDDVGVISKAFEKAEETPMPTAVVISRECT